MVYWTWIILCLEGLVCALVMLLKLPRLKLVGRVGTTFCAWYGGYIITCVAYDVYTGELLTRYSGMYQYLPVVLIHGFGYFWPASIPGIIFSVFGTV